MNTDAAPDTTPADTLADVATTHTVTEAERAAIAAGTDANDAASADAVVAAASASAATPEALAPVAAVPEPAPAPAATAAAPAGPSLLEVPQPPRDFDADLAALQAKYDAGEIDDDERNSQFRKLTVEQARFEGQRASVETHNAAQLAQFQQVAAQTFDQAAAQWASENKDFMGNPLRVQALQQAINTVDTETGGKLPAAELLQKASKIAFDAFGWDPAAHGAKPITSANAASLAARQPNMAGVPSTLGDAPAAGNDGLASKYQHLDSASVLDMEAAFARMTPAEQDAFLLEVDGPIQ